jgi:DNA-binding response OmpR family regulator
MTILLLDDDRDMIDLLTYALKRAGLVSIVAHDGPTALRLFEEQKPDLVVLNTKQFHGGLSGLEVLVKLRRLSGVPIIVLTGIDTEDAEVLALEAGADDYVTRPFSHRGLIARIRAQLRRAGQKPEVS